MTRQSPRQLTPEEWPAVSELNKWEDFLFDLTHIQRPPATDVRFTPTGNIIDKRNKLRTKIKKAIVSSKIEPFLRSLLEE